VGVADEEAPAAVARQRALEKAEELRHALRQEQRRTPARLSLCSA